MSSFRRTCVVLLGVVALGAVAYFSPVSGQVIKKPPTGGQPPAGSDSSLAVILPTDNKLRDRIRAAQDNINAENWIEASKTLQSLLDVSQDVWVQVERTAPDGTKSKPWVSVRKEANRLLGEMARMEKKDGIQQYQADYGGAAKLLLAEAKQEGDLQKYARVAERYLYTNSGVEATQILASHQLDRGQFVNAALWFEQLIDREGIEKLSTTTLVKAALAFHVVKDGRGPKLKEQCWEALKDKVGSSVRLGDKDIDLGDLRAEIEKYKGVGAAFSKHDWGMPAGNPARTAVAEGGAPFMEKRWGPDTLHQHLVATVGTTTKTALTQALAAYNARGGVVIPAAFPIAADGKLIFRTSGGISAVDLKDGKGLWNNYDSCRMSFDRVSSEARYWGTMSGWSTQWNGVRPNITFENSTIGTLSTDNTNVYCVDDLPVPPYYPPHNPQPQPFGPLQEFVNSNRLQAYNLKTGKLLWELGGKSDKKEDAEWNEAYFLGPPLPMHGKLYVLIERNKDHPTDTTKKKQEMALLCLDSTKSGQGNPDLVWSQTLAAAVTPLAQDSIRRTQAAHLAYGEGILVCPTNSGALLGVDYLTHSLVWAYGYRSQQAGQPQQPQPGMPFPQPGMPQPIRSNANDWKVSRPVVTDGKVVFTAWDATAVHCVSLRDGGELWKVEKKEDDLYLGGVQNGKVIIVGKKYCRALDLNNKGTEVWSVPTGIPSGMGVIADNIYYLPLKTTTDGKGPEVCQIDIDAGKATAHTKSRPKLNAKPEVAGNLLFYEGDVISQTLDEVVAFPQLKVKLEQMNALLAKNPEDPLGLKNRGEVNLDRGDHKAAVEDLTKALTGNLNEIDRLKARDTLYECITEFLQKDFNEAEKHVDVYKDLCTVTANESTPAQLAAKETKRRKANMYSLIGQGKEEQAKKDPTKLVDAFDAYLSFGSLGVESNELLPVVYDTSIQAPLEVLARAQISSLMAKAARAGQQKPLEERVAAKWAEISKEKKNVDEVRGFVNMFGAQSAVGREARLKLAEQLMDEATTSTLLEAERHLLLLRRQTDQPELAARAVETLARMMAKKSQMNDAIYYYRVLANDFPKVVVKDGKTGEDFYNELITDKRFWGYLDQGVQSWQGAKVKGSQQGGNFGQQRMTVTFEPAGEVTPFFQRFHVSLNTQTFQFTVIDRNTSDRQFEQQLTRSVELQRFFQTFANNNIQSPRFNYYPMGHMIVVPIAHMVYAIDLINKKVVWEKNLLGEGGVVGAGGNLMLDPKDGGLIVAYSDGVQRKVGKAGPVEPSYVCLQAPEGLTAIDPITGRTLWVRGDISPKATLFGDEQVIYAVEMTDQNTVASSKALRAQDGAALQSPDFNAVFQRRERVIGRTILLSDSKADKTVMRLYDVTVGKDVWTRDFPAGSTVLKSEEPHLVGSVDPKGNVTLFDLRTQKDVLTAVLDPKHLEKAQSVTLLEDAGLYYLMVNGPADPQIPNGGVRTNFQPNSGVRCIPVNGMVYAFHKDGSNKTAWRAEVPNQMLVLDSFDDLPFVLFCCQATKQQGGNWMQTSSIRALSKKTGKIEADDANVNANNQPFFSYNVDLKAGKVEMLTWNLKYVLTMEMNPDKK